MATSRRFRWSILGAVGFCLLAVSAQWYYKYHYQDQNGNALRERIQSAVTRGLGFLAKRQTQGGSFPTYVWENGDRETNKRYLDTPYTVAQVLLSLSFVDGDVVGRRLREKAIAFLMSYREPGGVWSHFNGFTPDVDDTALVWAAFFKNGMPVDPEAIKSLKMNLTEDGLFITYFPGHLWPKGHPELEISPGVNLNVYLLFALLNQPLPEVCQYIISETTTKAYQDGTLYGPPLTYAFVLSRVYGDGGADCLAGVIPEVRSYILSQQRPDGGWGNDLETALGVLFLLNAGDRGEAVTRGIISLLDRQGVEGGWDSSSYYHSAAKPYMDFGSDSLNTGLVLEAMEKYLNR